MKTSHKHGDEASVSGDICSLKGNRCWTKNGGSLAQTTSSRKRKWEGKSEKRGRQQWAVSPRQESLWLPFVELWAVEAEIFFTESGKVLDITRYSVREPAEVSLQLDLARWEVEIFLTESGKYKADDKPENQRMAQSVECWVPSYQKCPWLGRTGSDP
ncbi:hypothetical protein RRG08_024880 [Elysia crispata]|uniref:Uncharacterized protein n=1 Tax=Elysia crispata TaxID=231223 RepID=A0AAE0YJ24_9GAST|nr:hypothetical protein RRG08_024880 [Elysia crispata]